MEPTPGLDAFETRVRRWPDESDMVAAHAHPHANWMEGAPSPPVG